MDVDFFAILASLEGAAEGYAHPLLHAISSTLIQGRARGNVTGLGRGSSPCERQSLASPRRGSGGCEVNALTASDAAPSPLCWRDDGGLRRVGPNQGCPVLVSEERRESEDLPLAVGPAYGVQSVANCDTERGSQRGYVTTVEVDDAEGEWTCYCTKELVPTYEAVVRCQAELDELSAPLGGHSDGWGTWGNE